MIKRQTSSDRNREPLGRFRAGTSTKPPQGSDSSQTLSGRFGQWALQPFGRPSARLNALAGEMCQDSGDDLVLELMIAAVGDAMFRPGMVAVVQTAGDLGNWHPHTQYLALSSPLFS